MRHPWIKVETSTPDKPEICSIATILRLDTDTVVGKLVRLWSWAELNRISANDLGVTREFLDKLVGRKGFAHALEQTGWLIESHGKLSFRNFGRHNSPVAQSRALTAKRVARHRLRKEADPEKVTAKKLPKKPVFKPKVQQSPEKLDAEYAVISPSISLDSNAVNVDPMLEPVVTQEIHVVEIPVEIAESEMPPETIPHEATAPVYEAPGDLDIGGGDVAESEATSGYPEDTSAELETLPPVEPEAPVLPEAETPATVPSAAIETAPSEPLAPAQPEAPTTRKRRSKTAADPSEQPLLF